MDIYKDITLILVTYRSEKLILKNLEVLKQFPVIIVDNSNSDELDLIVRKYNNIKLIKSSKNLGYGKANNLAVNSAITSFILIIKSLSKCFLITIINVYRMQYIIMFYFFKTVSL